MSRQMRGMARLAGALLIVTALALPGARAHEVRPAYLELFVLALLLIVQDGWMLGKTVTAFTVAHSITLAIATPGWVHIPRKPVEATIALSIVFVASEIALVVKRIARPCAWRRFSCSTPPTPSWRSSAWSVKRPRNMVICQGPSLTAEDKLRFTKRLHCATVYRKRAT